MIYILLVLQALQLLVIIVGLRVLHVSFKSVLAAGVDALKSKITSLENKYAAEKSASALDASLAASSPASMNVSANQGKKP